jgi:hypothetical protein
LKVITNIQENESDITIQIKEVGGEPNDKEIDDNDRLLDMINSILPNKINIGCIVEINETQYMILKKDNGEKAIAIGSDGLFISTYSREGRRIWMNGLSIIKQ